MLAPQLMATSVASRQRSRATHFFIPATASPPAGSTIARVSSKMSWIAAQVSSVETVTTSSTYFCARRNGSAPTRRTATPSWKMPTRSSVTRSPAASEACMLAASSGSTPTMRISGYSDLT